jgi:nucleoporin NUP159
LIQLVSDYNETLPYKKFNNLAYASHLGVFAAVGLKELVLGNIEDLRKQVVQGQASFSGQTINIDSINNVLFTKNETHLLFSKENELKFHKFSSKDEFGAIKEDTFETIEIPDPIDKISSSYHKPESIAVLDTASNLHLVDIRSNIVQTLYTKILDFDWSPTGEKLAITKDDGTIRIIELDGSEIDKIPQPEDLEDESLSPVSISWLLKDKFVVTYGEPLDYDPEEEPFYDVKLFIIEKEGTSYIFHESYDAVVASGTIWRKSSLYSASFQNLSKSLPELNIVSSSFSPEISAITSKALLLPGNDAERASLPMNETTNNDVNSIGLIIDPRNDNGPLTDISPGIAEAKWLPIVWSLGHDGKLEGWYIFHVHDVREGAFTKEGVLKYEDELYSKALAVESPASKQKEVKEEKLKEKEENKPEQKASPFGSTASPFGTKTDKTAKPFTTTPAFGESPFGSSKTTTEPAFGSSTFGKSTFGTTESKAAFGTSSFGTGADDKKPVFGNSGFGSTSTNDRPAFGTSGFGQSAFGSAPSSSLSSSDRPAFGSSTFGTAKPSEQPVFGSSAVGQSPFGSKPSGTPAFGSSGFGSLGQNKDSPFASVGNKDSIFGGEGGKKSESPFASFGKGTESKTESPFASFGKSETKTDSPFASFGKSETKTDSPFASVGKSETKTDSPFASFGKIETKPDSPFAAFGKKEGQSSTSGLFGPKTDTIKGSPFESKPYTKEQASSLFGSQTEGASPFGAKTNFLSGTETTSKTTGDIASDSDEDSDEDEEADKDTSDEDRETPEPQVKPTTTFGSTTVSDQSQGPTSFGNLSFGSNHAEAGKSSFGQSGFGQSSFGKSSFGTSGFDQSFGSQTEGIKPNPSPFTTQPLNAGTSGFGAFANKKNVFGGGDNNLFNDGKGLPQGDQTEETPASDMNEKQESGQSNEAANEEDMNAGDSDESEENLDEEVEELGREASEEAHEEAGAEEDDVEEEESEDEEDEDTQGRVFEQDENELDDLNEDIEENLNVNDAPVDEELDESLLESIEKELNLDQEDDSSSSTVEQLYREAAQLDPKGHKGTSTDAKSYKDSSAQAIQKTVDQSHNAQPETVDAKVQSDPIKRTSVGVQSFEDDEAYQGEFFLPASIKPYLSLKDVKYPKLSSDPIAQALEKLLYDTEAELSIVEENSRNIGLFLSDQLNCEVEHTAESLGRGYQWRLSEADNLVDIIFSKSTEIEDLTSDLDEKLSKLNEIKSDLNLLSRQSKAAQEEILTLELKDDKKIRDLRELPFESRIIQEKLRKQNIQNNNNLRTAEEKVLLLKAILETYNNTNNGNDSTDGPALQQIVSHMHTISQNYSNDTKNISSRIAKLNKNHEQILERLRTNNNSIVLEDESNDRVSTQLNVDESSKKLQKLKSLSTFYRSKSVEEITSVF